MQKARPVSSSERRARSAAEAKPRSTAEAKPRSAEAKPRSAAEKRARSGLYQPAPVFSVLGRWLEEPQQVLRLEIIRILAPLATLGFMSSRLAHVDEWIGDAGFHVPDLGHGDWRQPLYIAPLSSSTAILVGVVMVVSGLAVSLGFRARAAALVFAATLAFVALADRLSAFTVSKLSPAVMLALAASPCGQRFGVDAALFHRKNPDVPPPEQIPGGSVRFFQLLLPTIYSASGIFKIRGDWLKHPLVLWTQIHDSYQTWLTYALARALPSFAWTALQAVTLVFEALAPLWFALPRTRKAALAAGIAMHVMIGVMFWPVRWFALLMISMLLGAYLPDGTIDRLQGLLSRRRPSAPPPSEP